MQYARKLRKGDKIAIVSLSSGMLGEEFCSHDIEIGVKRLKEYGLEPVFMPNALKGIEYLKEHPKARAKDLKDAFFDDSIAGIICAIGGDDTYRTLQYLMEDEDFIKAVQKNPKWKEMNIKRLRQVKYGMRRELIFQERQLEQRESHMKKSMDLNYYREKNILREDC